MNIFIHYYNLLFVKMDEYINMITSIGIEEFVNCLLVQKNVRKGYLFPYIDYRDTHDIIFHKIFSKIISFTILSRYFNFKRNIYRIRCR